MYGTPLVCLRVMLWRLLAADGFDGLDIALGEAGVLDDHLLRDHPVPRANGEDTPDGDHGIASVSILGPAMSTAETVKTSALSLRRGKVRCKHGVL